MPVTEYVVVAVGETLMLPVPWAPVFHTNQASPVEAEGVRATGAPGQVVGFAGEIVTVGFGLTSTLQVTAGLVCPPMLMVME